MQPILPSALGCGKEPCFDDPNPKVSTTLTTGTCGDEVMVQGTVNNNKVTMLVDSGSQITIVRSDVPTVLAGKLEPTTIQPAAVNGTPLTFRGRTLVNLSVLDVSLGPTWVYVMSQQHMANQMLLGTDVLEKLGSVTINFQEKTVGLNTDWNTAWRKQSTHPSLGSGPYPQCCRISLQGTQVTPPRHEKLCRVAVDAPPYLQGLVEPDAQLIVEKGVACAHSLNQIREDQTTWVRLCNPSNEPVTLYEGSTMSSFHPGIRNSVSAQNPLARICRCVFMGRGTLQDLPNQAQNPQGVSYPLKIPTQTNRSS